MYLVKPKSLVGFSLLLIVKSGGKYLTLSMRSPAMTEKDELVQRAKLAEQAER